MSLHQNNHIKLDPTSLLAALRPYVMRHTPICHETYEHSCIYYRSDRWKAVVSNTPLYKRNLMFLLKYLKQLSLQLIFLKERHIYPNFLTLKIDYHLFQKKNRKKKKGPETKMETEKLSWASHLRSKFRSPGFKSWPSTEFSFCLSYLIPFFLSFPALPPLIMQKGIWELMQHFFLLCFLFLFISFQT